MDSITDNKTWRWPDHGVYTRGESGSQLIVGVYVDDLIITGDNTSGIHEFKGEMKNLFRMSDLGALKYYLGIEVQQSSDSIKLGQSAYALKILEKAGLVDCNPCQTPMEIRLKLSKSAGRCYSLPESSREPPVPHPYPARPGLLSRLRQSLHEGTM